MNPIEATTLKKWLEDNGAVMTAVVEQGTFVVMIRGADFIAGIGQSTDDLEEAIRHAQHHYDLGVIQLARMSASTVGQA